MRHDGNSVDLNNFADFSNNGYVDGGILDEKLDTAIRTVYTPSSFFCDFIDICVRKSEETVDEIDHYSFLSDMVAKIVPWCRRKAGNEAN